MSKDITKWASTLNYIHHISSQGSSGHQLKNKQMTKMENFVDDTTKLIPVTREILFTTELFVMGTNPKHAWAPVEKEKLQT